MNWEQNVNPETREALRDIQEGITLLGQNKGKQSKGLRDSVRQQWSQSIAKVLSDATCPLEPFLQDVGTIPPSVTAKGAASAWPTMSDERRTAYLRWVDTLDADRSGSQKAVLIPRLLHSSPSTAIELLCTVSLANQDVKGRLASSLLGNSLRENELLLPGVAPDYRIRKVLICLLQLCETPKVTSEARCETIRLALVTLIRRNLHTDSLGNDLLNQIAAQLLNLPQFLKEKIRSLLTELAPQLNMRFFPEEKPEPQLDSAPQQPEPLPPNLPGTFESAPPRAVTEASNEASSITVSSSTTPPPLAENDADTVARSGLMAQLADWLTSLKDRTRMLEALHHHISSLEARQEALDAELLTARMKAEEQHSAAARAAASHVASEERIRTLEVRLRQSSQAANLAQEHAAALETRISAMVEHESATRKQLEAQEDRASKERLELQQRIQSNAERRLEEFRNGVGGSLARLLHGLPRRGTPVSGELGDMILTRLYEVVDFLESKGIRTASGPGDRR